MKNTYNISLTGNDKLDVRALQILTSLCLKDAQELAIRLRAIPQRFRRVVLTDEQVRLFEAERNSSVRSGPSSIVDRAPRIDPRIRLTVPTEVDMLFDLSDSRGAMIALFSPAGEIRYLQMGTSEFNEYTQAWHRD